MSAETSDLDYDPLEALWALKWLDPDSLTRPSTLEDESNRSLEFQERVVGVLRDNS